MRLFRLLALLSVLILLTVAPSQAGPGTEVIRGNYPTIWYSWNDYEVTNIVFTSSDPQYYIEGFCNNNWPSGPPPPEWKLMTYQAVLIASGKNNERDKGPLFTRVYGGFSTPLPPDGSLFTQAWVCDVLQGTEGQLLAEGISEIKINGNNNCNLGPGQNTWDWRAVGNLYAYPAVCSSGMAHFDVTFHYMLTEDAYVDPSTCSIDDPTHIRSVVIRGPDLKCIGK